MGKLKDDAQHLIYTDGAAPDNQNGCKSGGIGVAVYDSNNQLIKTYKARIEPSHGMSTTTNVRCEMLAIIKALEIAKHQDIILTDSQMIVRGYNEWLLGWKSKGWKNASKKPVANRDLWMRIDELKCNKPHVTLRWVKGHDGIEGNELADSLATEAAS